MKNKLIIYVSALLLILGSVFVGCGKDDGASDVTTGTKPAVTAGSHQANDTAELDETIPVESGTVESGDDNPSATSVNGDTDVTDKQPNVSDKKPSVSDGKTEKTEKTPANTDGKAETTAATTTPLVQVLPDGGLVLPDDVWE